MSFHVLAAVPYLAFLPMYGCRSYVIDRADRGVYRLIEDRQKDALHATTDVRLGKETGDAAAMGGMYSYTPHPVDPTLPEAFQTPQEPPHDAGDTEAAPVDEDEDETGAEISASIFLPGEEADVQVFGLKDALAYAMRHGRDLHSAKEDLYLAALDLTLERHLWTPQFVASFEADAEFKDAGGLSDAEGNSDYERSISAVSTVAMTQRLPYGGALTARVISTLVRDLEAHVTSGESGSVILDATVPLLRGAGPSADTHESRYVAERELIYAVRTYERFRRSYVVAVARMYFDLQRDKAAIANAYKSYQNRKQDWEKAEFIDQMGRSRTIFEAPRAKSSFRTAEAALVSTKEQYETALDRFKIFVGMPVSTLLDVVGQEDDENAKTLDALLPQIDSPAAIETALRYRLDLLTEADRVDDARRAAVITKNRMLPDLDFTAGLTLDSEPDHFNSVSYNTERSTFGGGIALRMDDRKTERNAYRAGLIALRRARRDFEQFVDTVRADVRRAQRRIREQENLRAIQALNVEENEFRYDAARTQFDLGKSTNQDVVDADNELLAARNELAAAVASYRNAILEFRLDTGTLRVSDEGSWEAPPGAQPTGRRAQ